MNSEWNLLQTSESFHQIASSNTPLPVDEAIFFIPADSITNSSILKLAGASIE